MGRWSRAEIEEAFGAYQEAARRAGATGDWNPWADLFTEDATYLEAHYGRFEGREAIREWITSTMAEYPNCEMTGFPIDWYVIDEDEGRVVCRVWNRMQDPGDGSVHQEANLTVLQYAGSGMWSHEEDQYNPANFAPMIRGYLDRRRELAAGS